MKTLRSFYLRITDDGADQFKFIFFYYLSSLLERGEAVPIDWQDWGPMIGSDCLDFDVHSLSTTIKTFRKKFAKQCTETV